MRTEAFNGNTATGTMWTPPAVHQMIERTVTAAFAVETASLRGPTRGCARVAFARQVAMYLAHVGLGINLTHVGTAYGRDRATVRHACRSIEELREEPVLDRTLDVLEAILRGIGRQCRGENEAHG